VAPARRRGDRERIVVTEPAPAFPHSAARYEALFLTMTQGVVYQDAAGVVIDANPAGARILGLTLDELLGRTSVDPRWRAVREDGSAFPGEEHPAMVALRTGLAITGVVMGIYSPRWAGQRWLLVDAIPSTIPGETRPHLVQSLFTDITERQEAMANAERALRVRDEFLGSVSHDLRTPLGTIKGLAQLLMRQAARDSALDPERALSLLREIDGATTRMTAMVDELLDVTRLEAGRPLELHRREVDLTALVRGLVAEYGRTSDRRFAIVECAAGPLIGSWDADRLERVLANLLSNAVKYSPEGSSITVELDRREHTAGVWAMLSVRDEGIGIPAADLPHVFERFYRAGNAAGHARGAGIGLAGARAIVEQHGGRLSAASVEGAGSTFTVELPAT
jgi:signal transduction histidine kinase